MAALWLFVPGLNYTLITRGWEGREGTGRALRDWVVDGCRELHGSFVGFLSTSIQSSSFHKCKEIWSRMNKLTINFQQGLSKEYDT